MRAALKVLAALALIWLLVAYLLLPRMWIHYEHQPVMAGMPKVTVTADDIPGDPLNVALVGSEADVIGAFAKARWRRRA